MANGRPEKQQTNSGAAIDLQGATTGFEAELWQMADTLRGSMDAAEYKHVVLGLIFLKYVSDAFEERRAALDEELDQGADPEDPDEYRAQNVFWVPPEARWKKLKAHARQSYIGETVDLAMEAVEEANPALKDVLPKDYARPVLDKQRLGQLIDLVSNIAVGTEEARSKDVLGRVYEYFLSQFASAEGKRGGEFYTPRCVVKLLVEMLEPYEGRVYDPCCGSSGMFVQSVEFIKAHATGNGNGNHRPAGTRRDISIYGQEANYTTWRLAKMNLAIRGIEGQIAQGDTFHSDRHADLKADFVLANPPFNISDWGGDRLASDKRWQYGMPPKGNANFAWVQHIVHHLAPTGVAGFVLANGSMSSQQSSEGEIRKNLVEANLVDCIVALPGQLFYSTQIPACLWFLARDRGGAKYRSRKGEVLFIDAREMGTMVDRTHRELTDDDIHRITGTYHAWRNKSSTNHYVDEPGFCKSASLEAIRKNDHTLAPGRYVGLPGHGIDGQSITRNIKDLSFEWISCQEEMIKLNVQIVNMLKPLVQPKDKGLEQNDQIMDSVAWSTMEEILQLPESELQHLNADVNWARYELGEVCTKIGSGSTPRGGQDNYMSSGPFAFIRSQNIYNSGFRKAGLAFINEEEANALKNVKVELDDILMNITGDSVARVCQVTSDILPARVSQHVSIIRPDPYQLDPKYLRYYLVMPNVQSELKSWARSGGTRNALTKKMIEGMEIHVPPIEIQKKVAVVLALLDEYARINEQIKGISQDLAQGVFTVLRLVQPPMGLA